MAAHTPTTNANSTMRGKRSDRRGTGGDFFCDDAGFAAGATGAATVFLEEVAEFFFSGGIGKK